MNRSTRRVVVCLAALGMSLVGRFAAIASEDDPLKPPAIATENVPVVPRDLGDTLRRYQNVRGAAFLGWSPDGKGMLVGTRFGNTAQLHRVYEPGGRREQITFFDEPADGAFVPKAADGLMVVSMSRGGNEDDQLYRLWEGDGEADAVRLTDGKSRNLLQMFAPDGRGMIVASNARNGRDTDLYVADPRAKVEEDDSPLELLFAADGEYWTASDWSRTGNAVLISRYVSINESHPGLLTWEGEGGGELRDVEVVLPKGVNDGEPRKDAAEDRPKYRSSFKATFRPLPVPGGGTAAFGAMKFSPSGKHAYVVSDAQSEFRRLARVDLQTFEYEWLTSDIPWNVEEIVVAPSPSRPGTSVDGFFTINRDGVTDVGMFEQYEFIRPSIGKATVERSASDQFISGLEYSPDGKQLGFTVSRPTAPPDAWSVDLARFRRNLPILPEKSVKKAPLQVLAHREQVRWTYSELGGLYSETFVAPNLVKFKSFDGLEVSAWYWKPRGASADKPAAVLVDIHGGPEGQSRPYFSGSDQFYLRELGIAILRPNVRGSNGYGKTFLKLDNADKREDSVKDIGALLDWIAAQPELDQDRVAVKGASYGGYMVLASMQHYPERIKAGVNIVGLASFTTFLKHTRAYRRDLRRAEYGDERDPEMRAFFERINPTSRADRIRGALLVAHGRNDPRVPIEVAEELVEKVRANGVTPWTIYAADEGHGFSKKANRDYVDAATALFLKRQLE
ncbi:MAG: prolyl oligopeptidase family serine peptidase [Planctomycetaceae bacterium]